MSSSYTAPDYAAEGGRPSNPELPWSEPVALVRPAPETLPLDPLPASLRAQVESVSGATQTPPGVGAMLGLAAVSAAIGGKVCVEADPRRGWVEQAGTYTAVILPPGARKSPVYDRFERPIRDWEEDAQRQVEPGRRTALARIEVLDKRLKQELQEAARSAGRDGMLGVENASQLLETARAEVPSIPRLLAADATPEALVRLMAEQGGHIALLSPEGDPFRIADGRYSRGGEARLDELKRAWSGEAIRVDRVNRDAVHVPHPSLTIAITMQPSVLRTLANGRSFRGEGVLARVLWLRPDPGLGRRLTGRDVPRLDREAGRRYGEVLRRLLETPAPPPIDESSERRLIATSEDARELLYGYEAEIEREIGPGGRLDPIADWAAKAAGQAVRLALLLEVYARAELAADLWTEPIEARAMEGGILLMRALTSHALVVLDESHADPTLDLAQHVLDRLVELGDGTSIRDLHQTVRGRKDLRTVESLSHVLDVLEDRNHIRRHETPAGPRGGRPSPYVRLHPSLRRNTSIHLLETLKTAQHHASGEGSEGFEDGSQQGGSGEEWL